MKRFWSAVVVVAILALSACSGGGDDGPSNSDAGETQIAPELNIAVHSQLPSLDPLMSAGVDTRYTVRMIFEPLIAFDAEGEIQPILAEEFKVSEDGNTLTFTLREGVPYHDGSEMTEEDVLASFERWRELSPIGSGYFQDAVFDVPEEGVFTITLAEPMYVAPSLIADPGQMPYIMPADVIAAADQEGLNDFVGTGPYMYGEWVADQHMRLARFPDYVSPEGEPSGLAGEKTAYYEQIYLHFVLDASTRVAGIQSGEYDVIHSVPWDNVDQLENDPNTEIVLGQGGLLSVLFNGEDGVMTDINMRRAVLAAMDTEEMLMAAFGNPAYYSNNSALMPEDSLWYVEPDPEFEDLHQNQHLDRAKEYLDEAGYAGEPIRILTIPEAMDVYNQMIVLEQQLTEAGMNVELLVRDWPTMAGMLDDASAYEIAGFSYSNWASVPVTFAFFAPDFYTMSEDEATREAVNAMVTATSQEEALEAMEGLQAAFLENLGQIKTGERSQAFGQSTKVTGFEFAPGVGEIWHHIRPAE